MQSGFFKVMTKITPVVFSKENAIYITGTCALSAATIALNLAAPYIFSKSIDTLYSEESTEILDVELTPLAVIATYSAAWIASKLTAVWKKKTVNPVAENVREQLVGKFTSQLMNQSHRYHIATPMSVQIETFNWTSLGAQDFTYQMLSQILPTGTEAIVAIGILSDLYGITMGLTLTGLLTLYVVYNVKTAQFIVDAQNDKLSKSMVAHSQRTSLSSNYEAIHSFNNLEYELKRHQEKFALYNKALTKEMDVNDNIALGQLAISGAGFMGLSLYIGHNVSTGKFTPNDYAIVIFYLLQFFGPLANFGEAITKVRGSLINLEKVFDFLEQVSEVKDEYLDSKLFIRSGNANIVFKNVTFQYEKKNAPIFNNASFEIPTGKKTGIVGLSGGGKSTIAKLLYRFYDIQSGKIEINYQNIKNVSISSLRSAISIVPQQPTLFNDSLLNNIRYGGLAANRGIVTEEEVKRVAKTACLTDFIKTLPKGLETSVGEKGQKISGGQLQRVAIARAILKKPEIYIFDEATSALDSKVEQEIQENLDYISQGTTTLVITHRLSTIVNADKIIVLDNGKVVEQGTHHALVKKNGMYAKLWHTQTNLHHNDESQIFEDEEEIKTELSPSQTRSTKKDSVATTSGYGSFSNLFGFKPKFQLVGQEDKNDSVNSSPKSNSINETYQTSDESVITISDEEIILDASLDYNELPNEFKSYLIDISRENRVNMQNISAETYWNNRLSIDDKHLTIKEYTDLSVEIETPMSRCVIC
jgi:ATP-binding cassette, subfamily B, heavy metal transporter